MKSLKSLIILRRQLESARMSFGDMDTMSLGDKLSLTIIATGFGTDDNLIVPLEKPEPRKVVDLEQDKKMVKIKQPLQNPVQENLTEEVKEDEPFLIKKSSEEIVPESVSENIEAENKEKIVFNLEDSEEESSEDEGVVWEVNEMEPRTDTEVQTDLFANDIIIKHNLEDDTTEEIDASQVSSENAQKNAQDRVNRIQEHTAKLKRAEGFQTLKEPAYKRRSIELDDSKLANLQQADSDYI